MAGWWENSRNFSALWAAGTEPAGEVFRVTSGAWVGHVPAGSVFVEPAYIGRHPTRAAAMRAVAGRCDGKKGYGM
jgi:hypothetical protein